jgi:GWxTD domain-containing protein
MTQQAHGRMTTWCRVLGLGMFGATLVACASAPAGGGAPGQRPPGGDDIVAPRRGDLVPADMPRLLQGLGLLANGLPMPFTGTIATLPGPSADSSLVLVSLSLPTQAFAFTRENDRFRATYSVAVEARVNGTVVSRTEATQTVRVQSFKETQRSDESVLFQQQLLVPPGSYTLAVLVRDGGSSRSGVQERALVVPRFGGSPSTPIIALEVSPRSSTASGPDLLANARNTVVLGRDTELPLYVEVLDSSTAGVPLQIALSDTKGVALWRDSVVLPHRGNIASMVIRIPIAALGVGVVQAAVWRTSQADTVTQPVLISFGDELPVASFDDMIGYLRFFANGSRLNALKTGTPQQRAAAWAAFLRETDPISITPQNEALRDYFSRIRIANERFREDGVAGWLSDRGSSYVAFGEPDQILDQNQGQQDLNIGQRGRLQSWTYASERLRLIFVDQSGFGRWRFYGSSANDFASSLSRRITR